MTPAEVGVDLDEPAPPDVKGSLGAAAVVKVEVGSCVPGDQPGVVRVGLQEPDKAPFSLLGKLGQLLAARERKAGCDSSEHLGSDTTTLGLPPGLPQASVGRQA